MPLSVEQFVRSLTDSGLGSAETLAPVRKRLPADSRGDAAELAKLLVREKRLTRFQAAAVLRGKAESLAFGEYVLLDKLGQGGMGVVYRARHNPCHAERPAGPRR